MGNPNPFCACKVCKKAASDWSSKDFRMRLSIFIETSGKKILVDPTPDLRLQMVKFGIHDFDAILITHWHYDHMYGLCELETWCNKENIKVYCVKAIAEAIQKSLFWVGVKPEIIGAGESFCVGGVKITPFEVKHTARWTGVNCTGFVFEENGKKLTYVPDFYEIPEASLCAGSKAQRARAIRKRPRPFTWYAGF